MSNQINDANKMVSETPRTDDAYFKAGATMYDLAGEMKRVERELNEANQRIKRLEDCAETAWGIIANVSGGNWAEQRADWREAAIRWRDEHFYPELSERKAKEDKP